MDVAVTLFFKDCVRASLEDKMVIFVTHQVFKKREIIQEGTYEDLLQF